ncbi:TolC family outer membrane protein [Alteraurantiacibacter aestuarii]|uniref:TolC family outer membrane protein n=1 Tax=Alteraurantiacibacter aestuarii TaxID=650004 RepID=A0A844ZLW8_9SPHN|nr:TolC family outer membrane protein [Alteraurantiacibacter aestuarii]MXO88583.1 TolC family outer membrane protein [Alteraurantiacibacter aestuarii]
MPAKGLKASLLACVCLTASPAAADTLKEALAQTYFSNPQLEAARAQLRATDETVPIQRASGLPSLSSSASLTEFLKQSSASFISPQRSLSANIDLGVPLYSGGSVRNGVRAAENRVEAGRADLRGTESTIFTRVVSAYMDVIQNEAIVGLTANNVDVLSTNLEATSDRFEIGDLTRTDVAQSESRLALARSDYRTAQANLVIARENYIALVGSAPNALEAPPPLPGLPADLQQAVDLALEHNPDLIAARERIQAAGYDIDAAGAGRLPRIEAFASSGYQNYLGTLGSIPGAAAPSQVSTSAQAGLRLSIPIFQGGRISAQQRQSQANSSVALEQGIATERSVIAQVRSSYSNWQAARSIIASTQSAVDAAELSLEGVRAENSIGNRSILDVLNAEQELLRAQVQLVTARRNEYVAGFSLLAAMGRAEARDLGLESEGPLYDPVVNYERSRGIYLDWHSDPDPVARSTRTVDIPAQDGEISQD